LWAHALQVRYWTDDKIFAAAADCGTRSEFKNRKKAYRAAHTRGLIMQATEHIEQITYWSEELVTAEALKYQTRTAFQKGNGSAYNFAFRTGILATICSHMDVLHKEWCEDSILAEALKFKSRVDFQRNSSAYQAAAKRDLLDYTCAHMDPSLTTSGFNMAKKGILYYIRFDFEDYSLFKIGITNLSVRRRLKSMGIPSGVQITVIKEFKFNAGRKAYRLEQYLLSKFSSLKYTGDYLFDNGNTELFIQDVLGLDNFLGAKRSTIHLKKLRKLFRHWKSFS
jgi:hypothetical protein